MIVIIVCNIIFLKYCNIYLDKIFSFLMNIISIDTLRYFYSSVFQGFAALISFGIILFTVYLQKLESQLSLLEQNYYTSYQGKIDFPNVASCVAQSKNFYEYCKSSLKKGGGFDKDKFYIEKFIFNKYVDCYDKKNEAISSIKLPLISSTIVLFLSIICLLLVGILNKFLIPLFLLLLIFWSLIEILYTIKISLEFKIENPKKTTLLNKIKNIFYWKVK